MPQTEPAAIQGSGDEVRLALEGCNVPFFVWAAPDAIILLVNPSSEALVGLPADRVVGRRVTDFFSGPGNAVATTLAALESGFVDESRARRTLRRGTGTLVPVWVWSRAVTMDGRRGGVSLALPMAELGLAGRDPAAPWRSLATIVVGIADRDWRVRWVSKDIANLSSLCSDDIVGHSLRDLIEPVDDVTRASEGPRAGHRTATGADLARRGRLRCPGGAVVDVSVLYAPMSGGHGADSREPREAGDAGRKVFALVGEVDPRAAKNPSARVRELELRLQRIAAEVRAARIIGDVVDLPMEGATGAMPDLGDLTARQWGILSRLGRGERVPQIAADLFLSQSTVRNHLSAIFQKFGVHSQGELLAKLQAQQGANPAR